ncbi:MAG: helix-turn-helix domain-containing protein [Clostridium sp.]|uniref:helix-turn-helix domain-containing protein n=1 Tax=Clostridium sp. TaxID=1506 RepID=UPI003D6D43E3
MNKLSIGEVIFKLRKEKNITQEQLGNFIGVSTAAVSKWEGGISYPDITLLPILATFFNVSIDKLLNFKIELSDEEVMKIFSECESLFSSGDLDKAIDKSKEYILKYPGCYYLKLRIGLLFSFYSCKAANSEEKFMNIICYAIELLEAVAQNSSKEESVERALYQLGALYQVVKEEDKALEALKKIHKSQLDPDVILSSIYMQKNEMKKARKLLQSKLYKNIEDICIICLGLANSYMKDEKDLNMIERYYNLSTNIQKTFSPEGDSVFRLSMEYLNFARTYLQFNEKKKAMDMLHKMIEDIRRNDMDKPEIFRYIWCFNEIPDGERTITMNSYENIFEIFRQAVFDSVRESGDFIGIINKLKDLERKSVNDIAASRVITN